MKLKFFSGWLPACASPLAWVLPVALLLGACSDKDNDEPVDDSPIDEVEFKIEDLSAEEMANCYIVSSPGYYKFKADNQFNLGPGLPVPAEIHPAGARLLWQSTQGSIRSVRLVGESEGEPYIVFEVGRSNGNALIGAVDEKGNVVWSWHIWMPQQEVGSVLTDTGYEVMNLNLGAMDNTAGSPLSYGLLYQWGRKDPFPACATLTGTAETLGAPLYDIEGNNVVIGYSNWGSAAENTIEFATAYPTLVLSNYAQFSTSRDWLRADLSDDSLWGNPEGDFRDSDSNTFPNKGRKTCYDPSPAGWRVAPADAFRNFTSSGGYAWDMADINVADTNNDGVIDINDSRYGWHFVVAPDEALYFPAASRYDGSYAMLMGSMSGLWGNYWSNAPYSGMPGGAFCCLSFQLKGMNGEDFVTVSPSGGGSRADAYSIRCVRDN